MRSSFGARRLLRRDDRLLVRQRLVLLSFDQLDRVVDEVGRELLELLFGEIDVLEGLRDLVVRQEALFLALLDELVQLVDVRKGDFDGEHGRLLPPVRLTETDPRTQRAGPSSPRLEPFGGASYTGRSLLGRARILDSRSSGVVLRQRTTPRSGVCRRARPGCSARRPRRAPARRVRASESAWASAGAIARNAPSLTLRAIPRPSAEAAQKSPSAPPFATQPSSARMRRTSAATGPRSSSGCARIARTTRSPPSRERSRVNEWAARSSVMPNVGTPQPSTAIGIDDGSTLGCRGDLPTHGLLARVVEQPVAVARPTLGAAEREKPRVLARAVVCDPRRLGTALEVVLGRGRVGEDAANDSELLRASPGARRRASATCSSSRSGRARTTGNAWTGFADERRNVTSCGSPAASSTCPPRTATAWTR